MAEENTYDRSFDSLVQLVREKEAAKSTWREGDTTTKTMKVRLHPTPSQAKTFGQALGAHRYFWNRAKRFADATYATARDARVDDLEGHENRGMGTCQSGVVGKACARKAVAGHQGCPAHVEAQGPRLMPQDDKPSKCVAVTPPRACGSAVVDSAAGRGCMPRYFCEAHIGGGMNVEARFNSHNVWSAITLCDALMINDADLPDDLAWQKDIPYDTRQGAIRKYVAAVSSFFQVRKSNPDAQMPGFLSKKSRKTAIFTASKKALSFRNGKLYIFPSRMHRAIRLARKDHKRVAQAMNDPFADACDFEIMRTATGKWYAVVPFKVPKKEAHEPVWKSQAYQSVFLDPGGRTFQTFYSPDGIAGKLGDGLYLQHGVQALLIRADRLMGKAARLAHEGGRGRKRRQILKRAQTPRTNVHDVVRDLHRKSCHFLCANFKTIFIPPFSAPDMSRVGNRVINSKAVRALMTFAHCEFRNKLIEYAERRNVRVVVVSEAYTTRTCTGCGFMMDVGARKVVACAACGLKMDRDLAGARNLFLRVASTMERLAVVS